MTAAKESHGALNLNLNTHLVSEPPAMMGMYKRDGTGGAEWEIVAGKAAGGERGS